jgi:hypothetical protein
MCLGKFLFIGLITVKIKAKNKEEYLILNPYLNHMEKMDSFRQGESIIPPVNGYSKNSIYKIHILGLKVKRLKCKLQIKNSR